MSLPPPESAPYTGAMIRTGLLVCVLLIALVAATAGCKSDSGGAKKTPTPESTPTFAPPPPTPTVDVTQADAIRSVNVRSVGAVRLLEVQSGAARVDESLIVYADLTGDGIEEAVVPITLGGRAGQAGFVVLKLDAGSVGNVKGIFSELASPGTGQVSLAVDGGRLVESQGVPGPDDPECCPSELRVTTFAWNGTALVVESSETIPNPAGGLKGTPVAGAGSQ